MPDQKPSPATSLLLSDLKNIQHGFFTRKGGFSSGIYDSLNCGPGSDDQSENVKKNRQLILSHLHSDAKALCCLYQIHSNIAHYLDHPWGDANLPEGDAIVTREKNIALGILTADCAPVLFADPENGVIGAAHAGWKGALSGIIENTIQMMCDKGAERANIYAAIGPCISQTNYEVGPEFLKNFIDHDASFNRFFIKSLRNDHYLFDLKAFSLFRLERAGLHKIAILPHDTYSDKENFYSYRRSTHNNEPDYGRQISAIIQS